MAKGDDIEEWLIDFGVRIIRLFNAMPKTVAGKHLSGQLVCSGTSPAFNYGEARGGKPARFCPQNARRPQETQRVTHES